jgi:hypothetical protein
MREQLDLSREIVAALDARPRCAGLEAAAAGWDGIPNPLWRKRLGRHVRSCDVCGRSVANMIPPDRLLPLFALLPVPFGLAAALAGKAAATSLATSVAASSAALAGASGATGGVGLKAGLLSQLAQAVVAHPVAATIAAGALAAGAAVTVTRAGAPAAGTAVRGTASDEHSPAARDGRHHETRRGRHHLTPARAAAVAGIRR